MMHERESYAARIRDTPENRKSACYSFQFNRRCNRTALVVARTLHRTHMCATCMWNDSVSGEWTRFSDKLYWPRRWNSTREEYLSKFSLPSPLPHSPVISPRVSVGRQKEQAGKRMVGAALVWRKETTNARSVSRFNSGKRNSFFFSLSVHRIFNI